MSAVRQSGRACVCHSHALSDGFALDLDLYPETWDETDRERLAREIRIRTKPMLVAANKMDTEAAQDNWE